MKRLLGPAIAIVLCLFAIALFSSDVRSQNGSVNYPTPSPTPQPNLAASLNLPTNQSGRISVTQGTDGGVILQDNVTPITSPVLFADRYAGDFGQKIAAAITALPATGGVIDARMLRDAQSLSGDLTINKSHVTVLLGNTILSMGTNRIMVSVGTHSVQILGQSGEQGVGAWSTKGTAFSYSGTSWPIEVGNTSAQTYQPVIKDIALLATHADGGGIRFVNVLSGKMINTYVVHTAPSTPTKAGIELYGGAAGATTYGAFAAIDNPVIQNFKYGVRINGDADFSCNSNHIRGGNISLQTTAGGAGIDIARAQAGNTTNDIDLENAVTGIHVASNADGNGGGGITMEHISASTITLDSGATNNNFQFFRINLPTVYVTNSSANTTNTIQDSKAFAVSLATGANGAVAIRPLGARVLDLVSGAGVLQMEISDAYVDIVPALSFAEGADLSISSNAIAPNKQIHRVGTTSVLKKIDTTKIFNAGTLSGTIALIPTAAWTYDNTGNILGSGTAVVGRTMFATFQASTGKWSMSY
jgi:hypothetical protein